MALLIGYARCSTDQQDLTAQHDGLTALGVSPARIYVDHGLTGTTRDRPGLREAMAACREGDTLVVTKLDRLARSLPDARAIAAELTARQVRLRRDRHAEHPPTRCDRLGQRNGLRRDDAVDLWVVGVACATARTVAEPTTICVPAGRPLCSAMSLTRSPVTVLSAERGTSDVERVDDNTSSVPQSASGSWTLPLGVTAWPSTVRPVIVDVPTSPVAPAVPAAAPARTSTASAVISPANTEIASALTTPSAADDVPDWAVEVAVDVPTRRTEPSGG